MTSAVRLWAVLMVLVSLCTSRAEALDRSCVLVLWAYGALVWPDGLDGDLAPAESFAWRLGNAAGQAYAFWGGIRSTGAG